MIFRPGRRPPASRLAASARPGPSGPYRAQIASGSSRDNRLPPRWPVERATNETLVDRQVVEAARSSRAASRSDARTRISRGPAAVNSSRDESIASVSRYVQSMPADLSSPQTTAASGPPDTTVKTTPSSGSIRGAYSTPRGHNGVCRHQEPGDAPGVTVARFGLPKPFGDCKPPQARTPRCHERAARRSMDRSGDHGGSWSFGPRARRSGVRA